LTTSTPSTSTHTEWIAILDYGSQYTQLIARRVREAHVYCEILRHDDTAKLDDPSLKGIILSGGPASIDAPGAPRLLPEILERGVPVLGICYGMQLLTRHLGGEVVKGSYGREYGPARLTTVSESLFRGLDPSLPVWMSHGDRIEKLPRGARVLARSEEGAVAAFHVPERKVFALLFHPEVTHTKSGAEILAQFLKDECACRLDWEMRSFVAHAIERIRLQVGSRGALCAVSGGVDSSVAAALVGRAIGPKLVPVFVDHGLHRDLDEEEAHLTALEKATGCRVRRVQAASEFLAHLRGVTDPEEKRRIVGETFIRVFEREARSLGNVEVLVQGTLYPDVIESSVAHHSAARIKTHHNVGGLPADMDLELLEPLRELFKDEVRQVGEELGLPQKLVHRHPFPGPGLAVRVIGEITPERLATLRACDRVFRELLRASGLHDTIWQAFAVLLPVRSVGVMGDGRTYEETLVLRAVNSSDGMTADWSRLPVELLAECARRIINEVSGVNRVLYDITSKPPGTIEWE
jgi:GMP synthase (glutamine-hydrolysing)